MFQGPMAVFTWGKLAEKGRRWAGHGPVIAVSRPEVTIQTTGLHSRAARKVLTRSSTVGLVHDAAQVYMGYFHDLVFALVHELLICQNRTTRGTSAICTYTMRNVWDRLHNTTIPTTTTITRTGSNDMIAFSATPAPAAYVRRLGGP